MARIGKDKIRMNGLKVYGWQLALFNISHNVFYAVES